MPMIPLRGRADFVAHVGQEFALGARGGDGLFAGADELGPRRVLWAVTSRMMTSTVSHGPGSRRMRTPGASVLS